MKTPCEIKNILLQSYIVGLAYNDNPHVRRLFVTGEKTVQGCQHNFVHRPDPLDSTVNTKVGDLLGVDYSIPGASQNHPIRSGT